MSDKKIINKSLSPFTPNYDFVFAAVTDDFEDSSEFRLTEKNTDKLISYISYSWDGEIYWFKNQYKDDVLLHLKEWFAKENNHEDEGDDFEIINCFLLKETPNGLALIDTQTDMSSTIEDFLETLKSKIPNIEYFKYADCHLIDHLYLGRAMVDDEFKAFYFMYQEKIINSSFLLNGNINCYLGQVEENIVLTGTFDVPREKIVDNLTVHNKYTTKDSVDSNSWLWIGDKPGNAKLKKAQEKNVKISTVDDLIEMCLKNYSES
jgi:hypothetical protein